MTGLCYLFMEQIIGVFLTDQDAYGYVYRTRAIFHHLQENVWKDRRGSSSRVMINLNPEQENERSNDYENIKNIVEAVKGI